MGVRTILAGVGSVALLAGCGGGSESGYTSAKAVAEAAGCSQVKATPSGETTLFATDEVTCRHAGHVVLVDWFKDSDSLASFKQASKGSGYRILYGHDWAASCVDNQADCAAIQGKIGGSLH